MIPSGPSKRTKVLQDRDSPCLRYVVAIARGPSARCEIDVASKNLDERVTSRLGGKGMLEVLSNYTEALPARSSQAL